MARSYRDMILEAITADPNPEGSSRQAITNYVIACFLEDGRQIPTTFNNTLNRRLDRLVNNGTLTRMGNTFNIVPEDQRPHAIFIDGMDLGFNIGLGRVVDAVENQVPAVLDDNIHGFREAFQLVLEVVMNSDASQELKDQAQDVAEALQEREEALAGGQP